MNPSYDCIPTELRKLAKVAESVHNIRVFQPNFQCCSDSNPQQAYINSKICEANTLIDRVKVTLHDIKKGGQADGPIKLGVDKETLTSEIFVKEVIAEDVTPEDVPQFDEPERPKTRRKESVNSEQPGGSQEEFQDNVAEENETKVQQMTSLEYLKLKLNTIAEYTESESSSDSSEEKMVPEKENASLISVFCNTESVSLESQEIQVQPEVHSVATEMQLDLCHSSQTQTDKEVKALTPEDTNRLGIVYPIKPSKQLIVQFLPSIDIRRDLVVQKTQQLFIDASGKTHVYYKSPEKNVGYFEMGNEEMSMGSKTESEDGREIVDRNNEITREESDVSVFKSLQGKPSSKDREMVYKSFHLYDNLNVHDPGFVSKLDVGDIDPSIYKTFINPTGLPTPCSYVDSKVADDPKSHSKWKISFKHPESHMEVASKDQESQEHVEPTRESSKPPKDLPKTEQKEVNSKLWDIGLYCSKGVQCCLEKPCKGCDGLETKDRKNNLDDSTSYDTSYDRISLTISYSTETTTDSSINADSKQVKTCDNIKEEEEALMLDPAARDVSCSASTKLTFKSNTMSYTKQMETDQAKVNQCVMTDEPRDSSVAISEAREPATAVERSSGFGMGVSPSTDPTFNNFISHLTNISSEEIKRSHKKIKEKTGKNFTLLPVQIHGDCFKDDYPYQSPHLELAKNGRYKDEENLFYKTDFQDISSRGRALKYSPKSYKCLTSSSDTITMDDTISEGEIKCPCSASVGEVHRCKSLNPLKDKKQPRLECKTFRDEGGAMVREKRTYFDHMITYYIDKKRPLANENSSTSCSS